jgi:superfamily II DNA or RNA helicase
MATGIGKTKLLSGCITYLSRSSLSSNFLIIAPGETIYSKLLREFAPDSPNYILKGILGCDRVRLISGDDYLFREPLLVTDDPITIYIFNIQKLLKGTTKQRYKFHTFQETLGESFAGALRAKQDLVVLMDESHRYRGPEYFAAINGLQPMLGLEFTATPVFRRNVIYSYSLKQAIADGWVKRLRPIYRQNDASFEEELDDLKLRDGLKVHEATKLTLETYADNLGIPRIHPLVLINIELISKAEELKRRLEKEFGYAGKVLLIHSKSEDEEERRLVELEESSTVEIVVHCNKLREGWDVKNIFTIIPLRASISNILTAQTIGRGVRLPFGVNNREELDDPDVATLNVICYQKGRDNYARIVESSDQLGEIEPEDADGIVDKERLTVGLTKLKSMIAVPEVEADVRTSAKFTPFKPKVLISDDKSAARLVGVDVVTGEQADDLGEATTTSLADQTIHLAQSLIDLTPELKQNDIPAIAKMVAQYLTEATGSSDRETWERYLEGKRRYARADLLLQISDHIKKSSKVTYLVTSGNVSFEPFETVMPVGAKLQDHRSVPNEAIRTSLVGEYKKTIYEGFRFDSQQEKWLADALDDDTAVAEWLKVPEGKLAIRTPAGRYLPDFIVLTVGQRYLLEVKDARSIEEKNPAVVEKAKRAAQWCESVSSVTGEDWQYLLLRHDRIKQGDTLDGMLAGAVNVEKFVAS